MSKPGKKSSVTTEIEKKTPALVEESVPDEDKKAVKEKRTKEISEVGAKARFLRVSPKKARLVIDVVRGLKVTEALNKLKLINKGSAPIVFKLLSSAVANAENNFKLKKEDLYVKRIVANQGPTFHRFKPAAFGSAHPIRKRTTHLEVVLGIKEQKAESKKQSGSAKAVTNGSAKAVTKKKTVRQSAAAAKSDDKKDKAII